MGGHQEGKRGGRTERTMKYCPYCWGKCVQKVRKRGRRVIFFCPQCKEKFYVEEN